MPDIINHPPHYTFGKVEVIDVIEGLELDKDWLLANVVKYISRSKHKGTELQDLKKALWYLQRKITKLEGTLPDGQVSMMPPVRETSQITEAS